MSKFICQFVGCMLLIYMFGGLAKQAKEETEKIEKKSANKASEYNRNFSEFSLNNSAKENPAEPQVMTVDEDGKEEPRISETGTQQKLNSPV